LINNLDEDSAPLLASALTSLQHQEKKKGKKGKKGKEEGGEGEGEGERDTFDPLFVPRPVVDVSLTVLYNHLHRNKDKVLAQLEKSGKEDEVKIVSNKINAILTEIGDPIQKVAPKKD